MSSLQVYEVHESVGFLCQPTHLGHLHSLPYSPSFDIFTHAYLHDPALLFLIFRCVISFSVIVIVTTILAISHHRYSA